MTGILQTYARKHQKAIDFLKFKFNFMNFADSTYDDVDESKSYTMTEELELIEGPPEDGVYVYGLYIESAAWSHAEGCITEQEPGVIISGMPIVHFLPFEVKHAAEPEAPKPKADNKDVAEVEQSTREGAGVNEQKHDRRTSRGRASLAARRGTEQEPALRFEGEDDPDLNNPERYSCPVYKTSSRAGVLSTTGQSTNYILSVSIPIDTDEHEAEHWTLRGTAIITMLID